MGSKESFNPSCGVTMTSAFMIFACTRLWKWKTTTPVIVPFNTPRFWSCALWSRLLSVKDPTLSRAYAGHSVAEQNSVDLAWQLLLCEDFGELRRSIYTTSRISFTFVNWWRTVSRQLTSWTKIPRWFATKSGIWHFPKVLSPTLTNWPTEEPLLWFSISFKLRMSLIPCSTGKSTANGTSVSLRRCIKPTLLAVPKRILPRVGTRPNWAFSTFRSTCGISRVTSTCRAPRPIARNGTIYSLLFINVVGTFGMCMTSGLARQEASLWRVPIEA